MPSFYCQHVGEKLSQRDFPRSIGEMPRNFRIFRKQELLAWKEMEQFQASIAALDEPLDGWQIWGLPAGAEQATSNMRNADWLLLKSSENDCDYIGRVAIKFSDLSPEVSKRIWGEGKFSIIVLLDHSKFLSLSWPKLCKRIGYSENYTLRGKTTRITESKITESGFLDANDLATWCLGHCI